MRPDIVAGAVFPDYELTDHSYDLIRENSYRFLKSDVRHSAGPAYDLEAA
jgi:hypothetical protein